MSLRRGMHALAWFGLCLSSSQTQATDVSGEIIADATWGVAASPYNVTASVRVSNGARLTIEPGVVVYMAPGTSFLAEGGHISALGTPANRIVFTSVRDQAGASPSAAPGDWQALRIAYGNGAQTTSLANVSVRYGQGLVLVEASPTFQSLAMEHNAGPAISMDLQSSPQGTGLTALGNLVNGIAVPAGEMLARTRWALVGIPYVVSDGILHIGARPSPLTLEPGYRYLEPGESSEFLLSVPEPVTANTEISLTSSEPAVASVGASVVIPAGAFSVSVTVQALTGGDTTITATNVGGDSASAGVAVAPRPTLQISQSLLNVPVGRIRNLAISRGPASALASAATVTLSSEPSGIAQLPATVVFPAGDAGVTIPVTGMAPGSTQVVASAIGYVDASSSVTAEPLSMSWPAQIKIPIGTVIARLAFSDAVPPGGMTLTLNSSDASRLTVPASLPVPAGATGINVPLTGVDVGSVTLTAANASYGEATVSADVERLTAYFDVAARAMPAGFTEPFTVVLSNPAPQGGVIVTLTSSDTAVASPVQASVSIAAGASSAIVDVQALTEGSATITTGGSNLVPGTLDLTVGPGATLHFTQTSNIVGRGLRSRAAMIQLRSGALEFKPRRNVEISMSNSDAVAVTVPATVLLFAGSSEVELTTVGNALTTAPVEINASAAGALNTDTPLQVEVVESDLTILGLDNVRSPQSGRDEFRFQWTVPGVVEQQVAATSQSIELSIIDAAPANIVDGFYLFSNSGGQVGTTDMSAGGWLSASRYVGVPNTLGTYKVRAAIAGLGEWTSIEQRSVGLNLAFSESNFVSGKLLESRFVTIRRQQGGDAYAPNTPLNVSLASSDPTRVGVSAVVIPANASEVAVRIVGQGVTAATLVNATAPGYDGAQPLTIAVVEPTFEFADLDSERALGSPRDQFRLVFKVLSSADIDQSPRFVTADIEVIDASPVGSEPGIYRTLSGGSPSSLIDYQSIWGSVVGFVDTPNAVGSYALRATVPGLSNPVVSAQQTVTDNTLRFDDATLTVGKGLRKSPYLRLPAQPTPVPLQVGLSCAAGKCGVPTSIDMYGTVFDVPVVGADLGADTLTADSAPRAYGAAALPIDVVPLTGSFGFYGGDGECPGGWYITVGPGVANQELTADITIVDQDPVGILTESYVITIPEGQDSSNICVGLQLGTPTSAGSYRLRATIGTAGSFDSAVISSSAVLNLYDYTIIAARGLNSLVTLNSSIAAPAPVNVSASCAPANVCIPVTPVIIPAASSTVDFNVLGSQNGSALLTLSAPGYQGVSRNVEVRDPVLEVSVGQGSVQVGQDLAVFIVLYPFDSYDGVYAPSAMTFTLNGSNGSASVPPTVEIPAGERYVEFNVHGLAPGDYSFSVQWPGIGTFNSQTITVTP